MRVSEGRLPPLGYHLPLAVVSVEGATLLKGSAFGFIKTKNDEAIILQ